MEFVERLNEFWTAIFLSFHPHTQLSDVQVGDVGRQVLISFTRFFHAYCLIYTCNSIHGIYTQGTYNYLKPVIAIIHVLIKVIISKTISANVIFI